MEIFGHQNKISYLRKLAKEKKLPSALFFVGPEGVGKLKTAVYLASLISSKSNILLITDNSFFLEEESLPILEIKDSIKIDQIRSIISFLSLKTSNEQEKRVVLIDNFHLATVEAQNAFLKTLEEPSQNSIIIIISHRPENILPTIRSRVQKINFGLLEKKDIENIISQKFNNLSKKVFEEVVKFSYRRASRAVEIANNYNNWQKKKNLFFDIFNNSASKRLKAIESILKESNLKGSKILEDFFEEIFLAFETDLKSFSTTEKIDFLKKFLNFYYLVKKHNLNISWQLEYFFLFSVSSANLSRFFY